MVWNENKGLDFSVASCYSYHERFQTPYGPPNKCDEDFWLLWKMEVSSKIKAFGWRRFHNKLPTKDLLSLRGISLPLDNLNCILCGVDLENSRRLFLDCWVVKKIRNEIAFWVGIGDRKEEECLLSFME